MNQQVLQESTQTIKEQAFRDAAEIMRRVHIAFFYRGACSVDMFLKSDANYYHASDMLRNPTQEKIQEIVSANAALRIQLE